LVFSFGCSVSSLRKLSTHYPNRRGCWCVIARNRRLIARNMQYAATSPSSIARRNRFCYLGPRSHRSIVNVGGKKKQKSGEERKRVETTSLYWRRGLTITERRARPARCVPVRFVSPAERNEAWLLALSEHARERSSDSTGVHDSTITRAVVPPSIVNALMELLNANARACSMRSRAALAYPINKPIKLTA